MISSASDNGYLNKVPAVTASFWLIKVMSTTVGETVADYLAVNIGLGAKITTTIMALLLSVALIGQLSTRRYTPWIYWLCVVLVSIVGTQITDTMTDRFDISLYTSTAIFAGLLAAIFFAWWLSERTLSIHSIIGIKRELFYWSAILITFALGTAAGDLATEALGIGFTFGVLAFGALIAMVFISYLSGGNSVLCFWIGYILTRPLGASLGDLLSQSREYGGLGFGATYTSILFLIIIIGLVTIASFERIDAETSEQQ